MSIEVALGLPGEGKTYFITTLCVKALKDGRPIFPNFRIGVREWRWSYPQSDQIFSFREQLGAEGCAPALKQRKWLKGHGFEVETTFVPDPRVHVLTDWQELVHVSRSKNKFGNPSGRVPLIAIDEVGGWAPARAWQDMDASVMVKMAHNRKHGLECWMTSQHQDGIDVVIRRLVERYYILHRFPARPDNLEQDRRPWWFTLSVFHPNLITEDGATEKGNGKDGPKEPKGLLRKRMMLFRPSIASRYDTLEDMKPSEHLARAAARREENRKRREVN